MSLANILFIIVMLHLAAGFGWVIYKLEFEKSEEEPQEFIELEDEDEPEL